MASEMTHRTEIIEQDFDLGSIDDMPLDDFIRILIDVNEDFKTKFGQPIVSYFEDEADKLTLAVRNLEFVPEEENERLGKVEKRLGDSYRKWVANGQENSLRRRVRFTREVPEDEIFGVPIFKAIEAIKNTVHHSRAGERGECLRLIDGKVHVEFSREEYDTEFDARIRDEARFDAENATAEELNAEISRLQRYLLEK
jgi:hypothetical protein